MEPVAGEPLLEVRGLKKSYGRFEALRGLDLTVRPGEVYGFLGRNGAGKTTTIRILMGLTRRSAGAIRCFGEDHEGDAIGVRRRIGYVAQEQAFYGWMTPGTIGRFVGGLYPTWDDAEYARLLRALDLPGGRKIRELSGGMKAKLALALALAHRLPLLLLDEPTAGLDPVARREFLEMVRDEAERSRRTTFFSSHLLAEVERAADRVGIIDLGRTVYEGSLAELAAGIRLLRCAAPEVEPAGAVTALAPPLPPSLMDPASGLAILKDRVRRGSREVVVRASVPERFAGILAGADGAWRLEALSLEDAFIELVSKPLERDAALA